MKKINFVDILIILIFIGLIIFLTHIFNNTLREPSINTDNTPKITQSVKFTILLERKELHLCDEIMNQNKIYVYETNTDLGEIENITLEPYYHTYYNQYLGKTVKGKTIDFNNIYITFITDALKTDKGTYLIDGFELYKTMKLNLKGKYFVSSGIIYDVKEIPQ